MQYLEDATPEERRWLIAFMQRMDKPVDAPAKEVIRRKRTPKVNGSVKEHNHFTSIEPPAF